MVMPCLADLPLSKVETVCADKLINGLVYLKNIAITH